MPMGGPSMEFGEGNLKEDRGVGAKSLVGAKSFGLGLGNHNLEDDNYYLDSELPDLSRVLDTSMVSQRSRKNLNANNLSMHGNLNPNGPPTSDGDMGDGPLPSLPDAGDLQMDLDMSN